LVNQSLFSSKATKLDYIHFIEVQYLVFASLEKNIKLYQFELQQIGIDFRSRANDAKNELLILGKSPIDVDLDNSFMNNFLYALAAVYLLEGSRHGNIHILKIAKNLVDDTHQFLFLEMNQKEFFENWKNTTLSIQNHIHTHQLEDKFIEVVCDLYEQIGKLYDQCTTTHNM